jgi:transcription-repair coupling factor (superfamily II helicase)
MTSLYTLRTVLQRLTASGGPARPLTCNGLTKSAKGLFIAALSEKLGRPITLVTDKAAGAEELCEIIRFFMPGGGDRLLLFPPWEILPYEEMSPHPEVSGTRLHTLSRLIKKPGNVIIVTTVEALARKTLPPDALKKSILRVDKGDRMDIELLCAHLVSHGYARVDMVENRGEFAIRGGVVDVFAGYGDHPIRFEFMGDDVESIRLYNSDTQRSVKHVDEVTILPFREVFYHVSGERLIPDVESMIKGMEIAPARVSAILDAVRNGGFFSGMERLMSAFFRQPATLLDYLPHDTIFMADETDQVEAHIESFYKLMDEDRGEAVRRKDIAPEVESLFMSRSQLETAAIGDKTILRLNELALTGEGEGDVIVPARSPERYRGRVDDFVKDLTGLLTNGYSIVITAESPGGAERIDKMLREREMGSVRIGPEEISRLAGHILEPQTSLFEGSLFIAVGSIPEGFILPPDKWALITDDEIFGKVVKIRRRQKPPQGVQPRTGGFETRRPGRPQGARRRQVYRLAGDDRGGLSG